MASNESVRLSTVVEDEASRVQTARPEMDRSLAAEVAPTRQPATLIGLALSGGGIRSATFSLGVLEALARHKRLASFDYLSTVSGGGYIGSWLSAWIKRAGLHEVQQQLGQIAPPNGAAPSSSEPPEVTWLRRYSNYLAPRVGLLSADSLTLVATWLRNVGLNLIVLLSCLAVLFIIPLLLLGPLSAAIPYSRTFGVGAAWLGLVFLFAISFNLWHLGLPVDRRRNWLISAPGVMITVMVPGLLAAAAGAIWLFQPQSAVEGRGFVVTYVSVLLLFLLVIWLLAEGVKRQFPSTLFYEAAVHILGAGIALATGIGVLTAAHSASLALNQGCSQTGQIVLLATLGPPAVLLAFSISSSVYTGIVGRVFFERSREWWSRLNAWFLILGGIWFVVCLLAFFALPTFKWFSAQIGVGIAVLGTGWIGSLFTSLFARVSETAPRKTQRRVEGLLNIAASVFVAGLVFVVAAGTSSVLFASAGMAAADVTPARLPPSVSFDFNAAKERTEYRISMEQSRDASFADFVDAHVAALDRLGVEDLLIRETSTVTWAFAFVLAVLVLFGWRVDVNKFSLHNMYKNRLVRCYLGASNQASRNEQPFTGLDDSDDVPLRDLASGPERGPVQRPFHILSAALNISQGSNLAWQERKAASFVFTPLYCGFSLAPTQGDTTLIDQSISAEIPAYRPTVTYAALDGEEPGFTLGMAMATSGAAVSPTMGPATRPALAFLLTLFNARLGRWSPNPGSTKWRRPSPRFGLICLLQELFGHSNEQSNFVYLSDGGHFDNTGLYELVRRRCAVIFAVDAGADPQRQFGDLAEAIRKCRVDLGVEISIEELELLRGDESMRADRGFVEGTIHYDLADPSKSGRLIVMKPTLRSSKKEPPDVLNYAVKNPPFPQQTTADQFFDESQFESYRQLGLITGQECLDKYADLLPVHATAPVTATILTHNETPTFATKWLAALLAVVFRRRLEGRELPPRAGALVDFLVVVALLFLLLLAGFALFDLTWLPGAQARVCLSLTSCQVQAQDLLGAVDTSGPIWTNPLFWRTVIDNFFGVVYLGMFIMGFTVAVTPVADPTRAKRRRILFLSLCGLALLTAGVDYIENALLLSSIGVAPVPVDAAAQLAPFTALKFILFAASLVALLACLPSIVAHFRERWDDILVVARRIPS